MCIIIRTCILYLSFLIYEFMLLVNGGLIIPEIQINVANTHAGDENRSTCSNSALIQKWANSMSEARPDVPPLHWNQANMAASTRSNMDITASISGILNEKHCPEHLQVLKTFTTSLRDKEYRWV